jgi:UDP-N-acetylmuramate: L-alanyl-gamma-D-glutamyl-meso-diaminopimelate ligase
MPELVVVGNAVSRDNPEVIELINRKIPYISLPQAISKFFLNNKKSIVVAGTHGKTTTSALLAWGLEYIQLNPSFLVGGITRNFESSFRIGKGELFVIEGDEYDTAFFDKSPKFLHYNPEMVIITGIEFDHADIYRDLGHIRNSFKRLVEIIPSNGYLSIYNEIRDIANIFKGDLETYSMDNGNWRIKDFRFGNGISYFSVLHNGKIYGDFETSLLGRHNILNALAVISVANRLNISKDIIREAIRSFKGVKRRQEIIYNVNNIMVIDDFAHHPTAVRETISAIRNGYKDRRIWAIFEPRSNTSRRNVFQDIWPYSFLEADQIIISDVYNKDKINVEERLSPQEIVNRLKIAGKDAFFIPCVDDIVEFLIKNIKPFDIILIMSNGAFGGIYRKILERLDLIF